jgi:hypothetical protein
MGFEQWEVILKITAKDTPSREHQAFIILFLADS